MVMFVVSIVVFLYALFTLIPSRHKVRSPCSFSCFIPEVYSFDVAGSLRKNVIWLMLYRLKFCEYKVAS